MGKLNIAQMTAALAKMLNVELVSLEFEGDTMESLNKALDTAITKANEGVGPAAPFRTRKEWVYDDYYEELTFVDQSMEVKATDSGISFRLKSETGRNLFSCYIPSNGKFTLWFDKEFREGLKENWEDISFFGRFVLPLVGYTEFFTGEAMPKDDRLLLAWCEKFRLESRINALGRKHNFELVERFELVRSRYQELLDLHAQFSNDLPFELQEHFACNVFTEEPKTDLASLYEELGDAMAYGSGSLPKRPTVSYSTR